MADGELDPRERVRAGARVGLGLAAAAFALAVTFGATARQEGWGILLPIVCSIVVFSGSAQFALVTALGGGGALLPAVTSAALVNARFLPMGMAVAPGLRVGPLRRALFGQRSWTDRGCPHWADFDWTVPAGLVAVVLARLLLRAPDLLAILAGVAVTALLRLVA